MGSLPIKVLIVDDSATARDLLAFVIDSDPQLKVIGYAIDGEDALEFIKKQKPDVITMDIIMPKMDGFEATRRIMEMYPIPIIIVSNSFHKEDTEKSFKAIEAGALAILEKPKSPNDLRYYELAKSIVESIKIMSEVKLLTRRPYFQKQPLDRKTSLTTETRTVKSTQKIELIAIGASLGGPQALEVILSQLPATLPVPILIVQHIAHGFVQGLVDWLSGTSSLKVHLAKHGDHLLPGHVYIAPDKFHMEVSPNRLILLYDDPPEGGLRPSVARLFRSVAKNMGSKAIGVILTGMGKDGADDLLLMRRQGGITIAQDEESCVIFGMPGEAIKVGAAEYVLPLNQISPQLLNMLKNL